MNAEFPRVLVSPYGFHLPSQIRLRILNIAFPYFRLKIASVFYPIRWVDIYCLNFASQSLPLRERGHDRSVVAEDEAIRPVDRVAVKLDRLGVGLLGIAEEAAL